MAEPGRQDDQHTASSGPLLLIPKQGDVQIIQEEAIDAHHPQPDIGNLASQIKKQRAKSAVADARHRSGARPAPKDAMPGWVDSPTVSGFAN